MTQEEATEHALVFGKSCFNCDNGCCDNENEDSIYTTFWCDIHKLKMNKLGFLNCLCEKWIVRDDSN